MEKKNTKIADRRRAEAKDRKQEAEAKDRPTVTWVHTIKNPEVYEEAFKRYE